MGNYEKLGLRTIGILIIEFLTWTRIYGISTAAYLSIKLFFRKKQGYVIKPAFLKHPVKLRNNYSDKAIFLQVFLERQYHLFDRPLPGAATIIDGGANVGLASIYFSNLFPNARIAAVEPDLENFELLKLNVVKYKNVNCLKNAIWHRREELSIKNPDSLAAGFIVEKSGDDKSRAVFEGITIDQIIQLNNWPNADIVKLDIEGAEREVFSFGDNSWIANTKLIIIELHDNYKEGCTKSFFNALQSHDYSAFFHHENIFVFIEGSKKH